MASAKLMRPEDVAQAMLRGMERGQFLIIPNLDGKLSYLVKRLAPWLVARIVDAHVRKVQRQRT